MKIAIVHDWLVTYAGSERVLSAILEIFPSADLFAIIDFLPDVDRKKYLQNKKAKTSFLQKFPFVKTKYQFYFPFMPLAVESFDLSEYNLIISSSHAFAKGVITGPYQLHISYVHTPIRYAWDLQEEYLKKSGFHKGLKGFLARWLLYKVRIWDIRTANLVDEFVANSRFIAQRIRKYYRRSATVIYPPVEVENFEVSTKKENFYLTVSRLIPYKRVDLIVQAFFQMPDKKLVVIGDGPELKKIKSLAGKNVELLGYQSHEVVKDYLKRAKAFIYAALEDFGIVVVEAQACGTPVIAYARGGAGETIINEETGILFKHQRVEDIVSAVKVFEKIEDKFDSYKIRKHAEKFSKVHFKKKFKKFVDEKVNEFDFLEN